ncbi:hypothetical protein KX816_11770 [Sphingosinicellaceae bacterium]|nr:hypothetical protein KX816_11770 [Sphingosinicellaceae bacterium]
MRFLAVTETCDLVSLYMRLVGDGHEVRVHVSDPGASGTGAGLFDRVTDWRAQLNWIREAGDEGIIIFEAVSEGFGALQDELRLDGFNVVGGSAEGDRLENDRAYAQAVLGTLGFPIGHTWEFHDFGAADAFLADNPGRYVLKFSGPDFASSDNYIGQLNNGRDVRAVLAARQGAATFILMAFIEGVEIGVGAWFDGDNFLMPACIDWEHKRFFAGDMGELTGEMGTVATFEGTQHFFDLTLAKVAEHFRGHAHVGWINLNCIVNAAGIWPLEFTCRFGYPGFAVLEPLQVTRWAEIFRAMVIGAPALETRPGFSLGVVLTTPPFPYTRKQVPEPVGLPVLIDATERANLHYGEVGLDAGGALVTSGLYGWTMVVTGTGATVIEARDDAYARVRGVVIPNMRYRLDIGQRLIDRDLATLKSLGLFEA